MNRNRILVFLVAAVVALVVAFLLWQNDVFAGCKGECPKPPEKWYVCHAVPVEGEKVHHYNKLTLPKPKAEGHLKNHPKDVRVRENQDCPEPDPQPTMRWCHWDRKEGAFVAIADTPENIRKNHGKHTPPDKPWVEGMDANCEFPPPVCEVESYSCEACQNDPMLHRERLGICYDKFVSYCGEVYGCGWVPGCPENGLVTHLEVCRPEWVCKDTCEEPEPTPTPEPKPEVRGTTPAGPPVCEGEPVTVAPSYNAGDYVRVDGDTLVFNWGVTDPHAQSYGIYYGTEEDNLPWYTEVAGHETTSVEINGLPAGHIWRSVCSIGACGDQVCGPSLDP